MKRILFKTVQTVVHDHPTELDYKEEIYKLMLIPLDPQKGTNYEEMAVILPVMQKFKAATKDYVLLEDAEHGAVVKRLKNAHFTQNTPEIFEMIQSVVDAPEHVIEVVHESTASE